jgi:hypothetical protein
LFAVQYEDVFVRFDSNDNWVCRANTRTEDVLKLLGKSLRNGQRIAVQSAFLAVTRDYLLFQFHGVLLHRIMTR